MGVHLGNGWHLTHLTDRCIEFRKACHVRRRITGRDGFVRVRAEPGMDRQQMFETAHRIALKDDAILADVVANQIVPANIKAFQARQRALANGAFATPEDPEIIGVKGVRA